MTKQSQEAQDTRDAEAAKDQLAEAATDQKSETRALAIVAPGTSEAKAVRQGVQAVADIQKLPLFEEAMAAAESIEEGDNRAANQLSQAYGNKSVKFIIRVPEGPTGGLGWHCAVQEKGNLTPEQSKELADLIDSKIDVEKMQEAAERSRAKKERKKARRTEQEGKEPQIESDTTAEKKSELMEKVFELVASTEDLSDLKELVLYCQRHQLLDVSWPGRHWKVKGLEGNQASHELATKINSRKNQFLREIRNNRKKIDRVLQQIEYTPDPYQLDVDSKSLDNKKRVEKKITGPAPLDFEVLPIKGKQGSKEIAMALNEKRDEFLAEETRRKDEKAGEELEDMRRTFKLSR